VVTELPPESWTADYREWLEKELADGRIKDFVDVSTDMDINIRIKGITEEALTKSITTKFKITNMHAFNHKGVITKYDSANTLLKEYAEVRLALYETRRKTQIQHLHTELPYHENVVRFIKDQIADKPTLDLRKKAQTECDALLSKHSYAKIDDSFEYIMKLPVRSFTAEQVVKHETQLADLRAEIARLNGLKPAEMWLNDLTRV
jgi:DNA topoisomerase-2